ncbi:hypothetical protein [Nonomuraea endophytica]|uniref:Uncharacterized protein n=1 Tax=Nonomuraea endophytica TaxID=714136 RepID=A0A7W8EMY8_9ACTN|nr:hypothetical protein [Nonomuraea endophytica]MBB5085166.1 hypothetical protein [Nonomuraea endophytica]
MPRILTIGLHPSAIDFTKYPHLDEQTLTERIAQGEAALRAAGLDTVSCLVGADPDEAEKTVREALDGDSFGVVMIGAGVRMAPEHTILFERLTNVLVTMTPGIRFCFNTSPETTIDAIRRWT